MNSKNVVIATIVSLAVLYANPTTQGSNEVAEVPVASADVPLATELPFVQSNIVPLTHNVQKEANSEEVVENLEEVEKIQEEPVKDDFKKYDLPIGEDLQRLVWDLSKQYGIQYELILSIMKTESDFNPKAKSYDGSSMGLLQINIRNTFQGNAEQLGIKNADVFNPAHNIEVGTYILSQRRDSMQDNGYKDNSLDNAMLMAYRYGISGANSRMKSNNPLNFDYVKKVLRFRDLLIKGEYEYGKTDHS
jgi:soluble lytic murein transglycosylase-like protein